MNWPPSAKSPTSDLSTVPSKKSHSHFQSVYAQSMDRTQRIFWIWGDVTKVTEVESEAQHGAENKISTRSHCVYTSQPLFLSCDLPWTSSLRTVRGVCFCRSVLWYKLMKQIFCTHWLKWAECSPIILSWHHFCWGGRAWVGDEERDRWILGGEVVANLKRSIFFSVASIHLTHMKNVSLCNDQCLCQCYAVPPNS